MIANSATLGTFINVVTFILVVIGTIYMLATGIRLILFFKRAQAIILQDQLKRMTLLIIIMSIVYFFAVGLSASVAFGSIETDSVLALWSGQFALVTMSMIQTWIFVPPTRRSTQTTPQVNSGLKSIEMQTPPSSTESLIV